MEFQVQESKVDADDKPIWKQFNLFHAAFAQFCYTGAQIAIASSFINFATSTRDDTSSALGAKFFAGAQAAFAIGRFVGSGIMKYVRPRTVFLIFLTACIIFTGPAITQGGNIGISMLYVVLFFESVCFPTILALGMRGLGRHTKRGSGYIVAGVSGGACIPALTFAVADKHGSGISMIVPLMFFVAAWSYSLCVNFVPKYKNIVDASADTNIGIEPTRRDEEAVSSAEERSPKIGEKAEKAYVDAVP